MSEEELNKVKDLIEAWENEIANIKDENKQPKNGAMLDNGNSGEYTTITKKYKKMIEERLGYKIWKK